jgi:MOSC domain-containing protein YiiM
MQPAVGTIEAIHITGFARGAVEARESATLTAGVGIVGDRYGERRGTFTDWPKDHELTLVEAEAIESVLTEYGIDLTDGGTRRNLTTRGIALNPLVGSLFRIGEVLCEGTRLCEPCAHLEVVTGIGGLARLIAGRGGLRARILENGVVHVGDTIVEIVEKR